MGRIVAYVDFDGTLTTERFTSAAGRRALDPATCAMLSAFLVANDMSFVVSSTWRSDEGCKAAMVAGGLPLDRLHADWRTAPAACDAVDFATGDVVRATPASRGDEIAAHALLNGVTRFVVLDDDPSIDGRAARWWVRPDPSTGLVPADMAEAQRLVDGMMRCAVKAGGPPARSRGRDEGWTR